MKNNEKRKYDRYDTEVKIFFHVNYDVETKLQYQVLVDQQTHKVLAQKYPAVSRNVSAEGLCFSSDQNLNIGTYLHIEVYLPGTKTPVHMDGEVRWSAPSQEKSPKEPLFETGVKLLKVNGMTVAETIHVDKTHHVVWCVVLDSILGNFRILAAKKKNEPRP